MYVLGRALWEYVGMSHTLSLWQVSAVIACVNCLGEFNLGI